MNKIFKIALISLAIIGFSACESSWSKSPSFKYEQESSDSTLYLGKWYEIARHKSTPFQKGDCTTAVYSKLANGNIKVVNSEIENGCLKVVEGEAEQTAEKNVYKVSFGKSLFSKLYKGDYRVFDTDYTSYSLVYSCTDFSLGKFNYVWVLARKPVLPEVTLSRLFGQIETIFGIPRNEMRLNNQNNEFCGRK